MIRVAARMDGIRRTLIREIFDAAPAGAINLGLGQPDLPTPSAACQAGIAAIVEGRTAYTATAGDPELRDAVARRYAPFAAGRESVVITVGSQQALFAACLTLLDSGREVLYPDPGYPAYAAVARLLGAVPVAYPLRRANGFRLQAEDVERRVTEATALVILSAPSNPTGACHRADQLDRLFRVLAARGVAWISDEVYSGLCYDPEAASPVDHARSAGLVVSSLSKDMSMTGWRVGWVVGPPELIARVVAAHQYLVTCASSVSQRAALAAFTAQGEADRRSYLERFRARRALMGRELEQIPRIRFDPPDGAFYYFVDVSMYGDSLELCRRILERRGVITIPGVAFGEEGRGYLRLSFAASEEHIRRGVEAIGADLLAG